MEYRMEKNKKFRNHISIVFEQVGKGFYILLGYVLFQLAETAEAIELILSGGMKSGEVLMSGLVVLGIVLLIFGYQMLVWRNTWITIDGMTIVMERNTMNRTVNTIGIKNISNVNTEQNLFEMLVGTCKIKMDTNSLSTADATDVKIVLKKNDAEELKRLILSLMNEEDIVGQMPQQEKEELGAGAGEMLVHGFFSMRWTAVVVALVAIFALVGLVGAALDEAKDGGSFAEMLSSILILGFLAFSTLWGVIKGFLKFYGFHAKRVGDRLHIQYGLLKKVNYTIPVDKINAIRLIQSPHARIGKRYTAELINVGMGDEEEQEQSFFLMYEKEEKIRQQMEELLPEFASCMDKKIKRQPAAVWKAWLVAEVIVLLIFAAGYFAVLELASEAAPYVGIGLLILLLLGLLWKIFQFKTQGTCFEKEIFGISLGAFGREKIFVKYDKIQYVSVKQNFIAKKCGVAKMEIHLLASMVNQTHYVPYFKEERADEIKQVLLENPSKL